MPMDLMLLVARLVLAAVFAVAGIAKLLDQPGARQALTGFGVPTRLAPPLALLLPVVELAVAVALLPLASAWWGAAGAFGLLCLFLAAIAISLARGQAPDCHCFGQLHSEPAGWSTLLRNAGLAAVAAFVLLAGGDRPGTSLTGWLGGLTGSEQLGLAAVLLAAGVLGAQWWLLLHLLAQNGRLLGRVEQLEAGADVEPAGRRGAPEPVVQPRGLPVGSPAPGFSLSGLYGETMTLDALRAAGKPVFLLFTDPKCGPCTALLPDLARWQREHAGRLTIVPVSVGDAEANRQKASAHGIATTLLQQGREISDAYQAQGTPAAVLVRPDGTIGSPPGFGAPAILRLLDATLAGLEETPGPAAKATAPTANGARLAENGAALPSRQPQPAQAALAPMATRGRPAPDFTLPDLDGEHVGLSSYRGSETLMLFWNPGCGFCQRMLDDLKAWEAELPESAPALLVISTGGVETNREMGLRSTIVLDQGFQVGRRFGASGTPSAVLIDREGKIASSVAVGAPAVLELAGRRPSPTTM
jgi:peroxiredoxin/uncharacterized membrane protein YphA (DoxX/SURF4 family)